MNTDYQTLINKLAYKSESYQATVALVGGITSTELKQITINQAQKEALLSGLSHENSRVRWQCLQLLDFFVDDEVLPAIVHMLDDPIPKVRWHAVHALICEACKPDHCLLDLDDAIKQKIETLAQTDENKRVRGEAQRGLAQIQAQ